MAFYQFKNTQKIPASLEKVWDFISSPSNLKKITPAYMGFAITSGDLPEKMHPGMIISYKVSPLSGIKTTWVTEISHIKENEYFVDKQVAGPYSLWHHEHILQSVEGGVIMTDKVSYIPPFGILGALANSLFIRHKLKEIFDYRTKSLITIFGEFK